MIEDYLGQANWSQLKPLGGAGYAACLQFLCQGSKCLSGKSI